MFYEADRLLPAVAQQSQICTEEMNNIYRSCGVSRQDGESIEDF